MSHRDAAPVTLGTTGMWRMQASRESDLPRALSSRCSNDLEMLAADSSGCGPAIVRLSVATLRNPVVRGLGRTLVINRHSPVNVMFAIETVLILSASLPCT